MKSLWYQIALALVLSGCTSFHGLGDYKAPDYRSGNDEEITEEAPGAAPLGPTLSWSGERVVERTPDPNSPRFDWPVADARLSRGFLLGKRWHYGVDLAAPKGTPILAADDGVVIYTGRGFTGYGKLIVVEHSSEWATLYAHLNKFSVREGDKIKRGQKLGEMGRTGRASGVHLHFEIRYNRQPVNPLMYLPQGY